MIKKCFLGLKDFGNIFVIPYISLISLIFLYMGGGFFVKNGV